MAHDNPIDRAVEYFNRGELGEAIQILNRFIEEPSGGARTRDKLRARLYLASMNRSAGNLELAASLLEQLTGDCADDRTLLGLTWVERSVTTRLQGDLETSRQSIQRAEALTDFSITPETTAEQRSLIGFFHLTHGKLLAQEGRPRRALEQYYLCKDQCQVLESKFLVTVCLNIANTYAVLGHREKARHYLDLAFATLKGLDSPFAYGLLQLFEVLATFNLFVYESEQKAIDCLSQISEEVVFNFADFKTVFDFFAEVLVQRREGKFDLGKIRQLVREQGDDPLIRAYLPSLITGAPQPVPDEDEDDPIFV